MYKTILVENDIEGGRRVVDELEKLMAITAAFWYCEDEDDEWKLVIVSPDVAEKGPIQLYQRIAVLLNDLSVDPQKPVQMPLSRISLTNPHTLLYERVKKFSGALDTYVYKIS